MRPWPRLQFVLPESCGLFASRGLVLPLWRLQAQSMRVQRVFFELLLRSFDRFCKSEKPVKRRKDGPLAGARTYSCAQALITAIELAH